MKRLAVLRVALYARGDRRLWGCSPVALLIFVIELTACRSCSYCPTTDFASRVWHDASVGHPLCAYELNFEETRHQKD